MSSNNARHTRDAEQHPQSRANRDQHAQPESPARAGDPLADGQHPQDASRGEQIRISDLATVTGAHSTVTPLGESLRPLARALLAAAIQMHADGRTFPAADSAGVPDGRDEELRMRDEGAVSVVV